MGKRRTKLKKAVTLAYSASGEVPFDLRATDLPINAQVGIALVDDPYDGKKVQVLRSLRDDPLAAMRNASQIDECQYLAGRHWQRAHELSEVGGVKAIDPTKEAVDGGGIAQATISDAQIRAFADLTLAMTKLGMEGDALVRQVLGKGMSITDIAIKREVNTERGRRYLGMRFQEALDTLASVFGYAMEKKPTKSCA